MESVESQFSNPAIHDSHPAVQADEVRPPEAQKAPLPPQRTRAAAAFLASAESIGGGVAVVLGILALVGALPTFLLAIATIALGGVLLFEGGAIASRYARLLRAASAASSAELGGGMGVEMLGGMAGIVLGILALLHIYPTVLCAIAVVIFGGTWLLSTSATARLDQLEGHYRGWSNADKEIAREASQAAFAVKALIGVCAVILGILALIDVHPFVLSVVGVLMLGGAVLLSGAALSGKILSIINRE